MKNELKSIDDTKRKQEIVKNKLNDIGVKSPKNKLNDLTGKEWIYFLKSVFSTSYSTRGETGFSHDLRKIHPTPKPPILMCDIIKFFTKEKQWILDPFAGVGGSLLGASLANRNGVGIELVSKYINVYESVCRKENVKKHKIILGNSHDITKLLEKTKNIPKQYDLIITDPPYADMMTKKKSKPKNNSKDSTPFSNSKYDIGNLELSSFLNELKYIISESLIHLKDEKYCIIFTKDMQPKENHHNMLHADIVMKLSEIKNLRFMGYKIWHDQTQKLHPFGYPYTFVANQFHQFVLIFRKEPSNNK